MTAPDPITPGRGDTHANLMALAAVDHPGINWAAKWLDAQAELEQAERQVRAVEALLTEPSPAKFDERGNYEGRVAGTEHRTAGGRAWCFQCAEWCSESYACPCCEPKIEPSDLRAALAGVSGPTTRECVCGEKHCRRCGLSTGAANAGVLCEPPHAGNHDFSGRPTTEGASDE